MMKMGGANLISFTIDDVSYHAEEGMTWEQWVNSEYNTTGITNTSLRIYNEIGYILQNGHEIVYPDYIVQNGKDYGFHRDPEK